VLIPNPEEHDTSTFHSMMARGGFNHAAEEGRLDYQFGFDLNLEQGYGKRMQNGKEQIGDYALFASVQWHLNQRITFQPAIRASYNTKYESPLTPSFNLKYELQKTTFRASYARGFRAPSLKELYLQFYDSNHQIEGNEDLVAERSHNFNLTVSSNSSIRSVPWNLKAKAYYNIIQDRISLVQVDPENPLHYKNANTDHFESVGGDLTLGAFPVRNLSVDAGISYIGRKDSYYRSDEYVFSTSAVSSISLRFFKSMASVNLYYKYSGKYPVYTFITDDEIALNYLEAYHSMDLNLSVKLFRQQVRLSTGVKNIFDNTQLVGISGGSGHGGGDGASSLVGWGRTYFLGITYNFTAL
jgi:outer membrane receptor for ferrienterochelin and colicins